MALFDFLLTPGSPDPARWAIDWQKPRARGLKMCLVPTAFGCVDLVNSGRSSRTGAVSPTKVVGAGFVATDQSRWNAIAAQASSTDLDFSTGSWSMMYIGYNQAYSSAAGLLRHSNFVDNTNNQGLQMQFSTTSNKLAMGVFANTSLASGSQLLDSTATVGVGYMTFAAVGNGSTVQLYVNGTADASSATLNQYPTALAAQSTAGLGMGNSASNQGILGCFWNRALTALDVRYLHNNPLSVLQPNDLAFIPYGPSSYSDRHQAWMTR